MEPSDVPVHKKKENPRGSDGRGLGGSSLGGVVSQTHQTHRVEYILVSSRQAERLYVCVYPPDC